MADPRSAKVHSIARLALAGVAIGATLAACAGKSEDKRSATASSSVEAPPSPVPAALLEDLKSASARDAAVKRLIQLHADALSADGKDEKRPKSTPILGAIVEPFTKLCLDPTFKPQVASQVIKLLADTGDARATPCLKHTLQSYKPDSNEDDVLPVLRAVIANPKLDLRAEVMHVYRTIEFSRMKAKPLHRELRTALRLVADKSVQDELLKAIARPLDASDPTASMNQAFWQTTACEVLGHLPGAEAARPLVKVILSPSKSMMHNAALVSLVHLGKPAVDAAAAVLDGSDAELVHYSEEEHLKSAEKDPSGRVVEHAQKAAKRAHLSLAAQILGNIGHPAAAAPLLAVMSAPGDDIQTKVIAATSLPMLPRTPATLEAFRKCFEETKNDVPTLTGGSAKEVLAQSAADFFDPSLVPWLTKSSAALKGPPDEVDPLRVAIFTSAVKMMAVSQVAEVEALGATAASMPDPLDERRRLPSTVSAAFAKEMAESKALTERCKDDVKCYLAEATDPKHQAKATSFTPVKALWMVGALGKEADRDALVAALPKLGAATHRLAALKAIEALSPNGSVAVAEKLTALAAEAEAAKDNERMVQYAPFKQTAARLAARAR